MAHQKAQTNILFIANLLNMEVKEDLGEGFDIFNGIKITNNKRFISSLMTNRFRQIIGNLEADALTNSKCVLYSVEDINNFPDHFKTPIEYLDHFMDFAQFVITTMWLVKDNSTRFEMIFQEIPHKHTLSAISSNFQSSIPSNSKGKQAITSFTQEDFQLLSSLFTNYIIGYIFKDFSGDNPNDLNRIQRVIYFLQAARSHSDLRLKIAFYCTCFETLFSTDSTELTHKLAERLAFFVGETPQMRLQIFNQIKSAYKIRSAVIHGDRLSSRKMAEVEHSVVICDDLLRAVLLKLASQERLRSEFTGSNEKLEQFLTELIFGLRQL